MPYKYASSDRLSEFTYQACPYSASNGEHLKMTWLQTPLQRRRGNFFNIASVFRGPDVSRRRPVSVVGWARPSLHPVLHLCSIDASSWQMKISTMQQALPRQTWLRWKTTKKQRVVNSENKHKE